MVLIPGVRTSLRLNIEGPEYPTATDPDDAAWLRVEVSVICDQGSWRFRAPCLTREEAASLARWLTRVARHRGLPGARLEFTEPVLAFELASDDGATVVLRALFGHEGLPPFARQYGDYPPGEQFRPEPIDIEVSADDLRAAGEQLRDELRKRLR